MMIATASPRGAPYHAFFGKVRTMPQPDNDPPAKLEAALIAVADALAALSKAMRPRFWRAAEASLPFRNGGCGAVHTRKKIFDEEASRALQAYAAKLLETADALERKDEN
jgi:hypothetical protein